VWIKLFFEFDFDHFQVPLGSIDFELFSLRSLQEIQSISLGVHRKSAETGNTTPRKRRKFSHYSTHHYGSTYQDGPETIPRWSHPRSSDWMDSGGTTEAVSALIVEQFEETILPIWNLGQFFRSTMEIWGFKVVEKKWNGHGQWSWAMVECFFQPDQNFSEDNGGKWDNNGHRSENQPTLDYFTIYEWTISTLMKRSINGNPVWTLKIYKWNDGTRIMAITSSHQLLH